MNRLVVATKNAGKMREIAKYLEDFSFETVSMNEIGIDDEIEETGTSFYENAYIKAKYIYDRTGAYVLSDDSGLEVDILDGRPGIYSARFGGENATDGDRCVKLLGLLEGVPYEKRTARFKCVLVMFKPTGESFSIEGTCEGYIGNEAKGDQGFGYDPIFISSDTGKTLAEMDSNEKNQISHRGKALENLVTKLKSFS